jgi:hypothetical protein
VSVRGQRADIVSQFWNEMLLNHIPALQNQFAAISIHGVGVMMLALTTCIMPGMAAHALPLQNSAQKITLQAGFCKRLFCDARSPAAGGEALMGAVGQRARLSR